MIRPLLEAAIRFDAQSGEQLHAPMVLVTVGASDSRFVLDTGSDVHIVTKELADHVGLELVAGERGTDHAGTEMDSWLAGAVPVSLRGTTGAAFPLLLHDVVAIPAPPPFPGWGIGGILSPQRLHPTALAVLDLADDGLTLVDEDVEAARGWLLERRPRPDVLVLPRRPADHRPIVEGALEPHPPMPILINTGGRHTEFASRAVPGLGGGVAAPIGGAVSGADVVGTEAGPQVLQLGERRIALPSVMVREGMTDPEAMLGADVLRGTVVVVGPDPAVPVLWQVEEVDAAGSGRARGGHPGI